MELLELELSKILWNLCTLILAYLLALPIGWDREQSARRLGLRTFPLVAVASAGYILIARSSLGEDPAAQARIIQGLITGIGFLGGGAIVKRKGDVQGLATAASIWMTAAVGAATAFGHFDLALLMSLLTLATLRGLPPVKKTIREHSDGDEP